MSSTLHQGDCLDVMRSMGEASVDTVITDPPYGLQFMGVGWDSLDGRGNNSVTEIDRDTDFDRIGGNHNPTCSTDASRTRRVENKRAQKWHEIWATEALRVAKPGALLLAFGGTRTYHRLTCAIEDAGWEIRDCIMWLYGSGFPKSHNFAGKLNGDGDEWHGYGTALKPAWEPIIVAMKPLDGTFANNAERHGVAGLWIDGGRVEYVSDVDKGDPARFHGTDGGTFLASDPSKTTVGANGGRWPANVILDEDAGAMLDAQSGDKPTSGQMTKGKRRGDGIFGQIPDGNHFGDTGGASRFFYCAKASRSERGNGNNHPTVKPLKLMRYLARLTKTPMGGVVLDPFMGSGTTGVACIAEGRDFIGIEKDAEYLKIAQARIDHAEAVPKQTEMAIK